MSRKDKTGLEFEQAGEKGSDGVAKPKAGGVRQAYRLHKDVADKVAVSMNGKPFVVVDLGYEGIGVRFSKDDILPIAGEIVAITMSFNGETHDLSGKVVHISPDFTDKYLCGIQFVKPKAAFTKKLEAFLEANRSTLFAAR